MVIHTLHEYAEFCRSTELLWCTHCSHHAAPADVEGTARGAVVESPALDPLDQRFLERNIVRRAIRPVAALPLQYVARALYLHQHLVRPRRRRGRETVIEMIIEDFPGLRPCWQGPVLETLYDQRGFAQLPRDVEVPAVAGERRRAVEAGLCRRGVSPIAPHSIVLHGLRPDLVLSTSDDTAAASRGAGGGRVPEAVRRCAVVQRQREGRGAKRIRRLLGRFGPDLGRAKAEERVHEHHTAHLVDDLVTVVKVFIEVVGIDGVVRVQKLFILVVRVQRPPDVPPAERVAHQGDLIAVRVIAIGFAVLLDGVVNNLVDVAYPDVGACKAEITRVAALCVERMAAQEQILLLLERLDRRDQVAVAPRVGVFTGAVGPIPREARVAGIVETLVEARRSAVAEQARGEGVDARPRERVLHTEIESATARGGDSQVEHHRAGDCAAVDEHHGSGGHRRASAVPIHRPDPMHPEPRRAPVELSVWHEPGRHSEAQPVILSGYAGRLTVAGNHTAYLLLSSNP